MGGKLVPTRTGKVVPLDVSSSFEKHRLVPTLSGKAGRSLSVEVSGRELDPIPRAREFDPIPRAPLRVLGFVNSVSSSSSNSSVSGTWICFGFVCSFSKKTKRKYFQYQFIYKKIIYIFSLVKTIRSNYLGFFLPWLY